jgi:P-type conjugative transfer protein TrbJ
MKKYAAAALIACAASGSVGLAAMMSSPAEAIPVFDASNYAQNILTAARTLQQVNQQIQQLQNEAQMLTNMGKHLTKIDFRELGLLQDKLQQIDMLMGKAQGIKFKIGEWQDQYRSLFPSDVGKAILRDNGIANARARLEAASSQFNHAMGVQSQIVENVRDDAEALSAIVEKSQGAQGSLAAQQATNQLLALATKQQLQIQNLMAAQYRSESIEQARRAQSELEGRAKAKKFLGDGKAYTPR